MKQMSHVGYISQGLGVQHYTCEKCTLNFKMARVITPWIVLHSVQLLFLIKLSLKVWPKYPTRFHCYIRCTVKLLWVWSLAFIVFQDVGCATTMANHVKLTLQLSCNANMKWPSMESLCSSEVTIRTPLASGRSGRILASTFSLFHSSDMVNIFHNVAITLHREIACIWLGLEQLSNTMYLHVCEPLAGRCSLVVHNDTSQSCKMRRTPWLFCFCSS